MFIAVLERLSERDSGEAKRVALVFAPGLAFKKWIECEDLDGGTFRWDDGPILDHFAFLAASTLPIWTGALPPEPQDALKRTLR